MRIVDFVKLKEDFIKADTNGKIDIYINAGDLTQFQYRELLKEFPGFDVHMDPLSLSVACHIGPGALAVACCKKMHI